MKSVDCGREDRQRPSVEASHGRVARLSAGPYAAPWDGVTAGAPVKEREVGDKRGEGFAARRSRREVALKEAARESSVVESWTVA